jgi:hypothetical protein
LFPRGYHPPFRRAFPTSGDRLRRASPFPRPDGAPRRQRAEHLRVPHLLRRLAASRPHPQTRCVLLGPAAADGRARGRRRRGPERRAQQARGRRPRARRGPLHRSGERSGLRDPAPIVEQGVRFLLSDLVGVFFVARRRSWWRRRRRCPTGWPSTRAAPASSAHSPTAAGAPPRLGSDP